MRNLSMGIKTLEEKQKLEATFLKLRALGHVV